MIKYIALNMVVYNESHRIQQTLENIAGYVDEIVIVDQESTDHTVATILQWKFDTGFPNLMVVPDKHWGYCEPSRRKAWEHTNADWILVLDADERISNEFAEEMSWLDESGWLGARLQRSFWLGGEHRFTGDYQYRFFHRSAVNFLNEIHTEPQPTVARDRIYSPEYIGIWHEKTWAEQLRDEEAYERILMQDETIQNRNIKLGLNVHKKLLDHYHITPEEADAMSIEERRKRGIGAC